MKEKKESSCYRIMILYVLLLGLLGILMGVNLCVGSAMISPSKCLVLLFGESGDFVERTILFQIRLPRILAALFLGGALSLAGYLLQTFFSNPIAGPFVLGISSGAKCMVAVFMVISCRVGWVLNSLEMILASLVGSLLATGVVLLASKKVKNMAILIVCGVMIGYIGSAITELLVTFAEDSNIVNLHNWSMGSFSGITWQNVSYVIPVVMMGLLSSMLISKEMEAYLYGEDYAKSIGITIGKFRLLLILLSSILSATVTAFAGPVSFVGIAVPHVIRRMFRSAKPKILIPACFLGGGVFCLWSDLLARSLFAPMEISISTITAIFGAPVVLSMLFHRKEKSE